MFTRLIPTKETRLILGAAVQEVTTNNYSDELLLLTWAVGTGAAPGPPPSISVWVCTPAGLEQGSKGHEQINTVNPIISIQNKGSCRERRLYKDSEGVCNGGSQQSLRGSEGQMSLLLLFLTEQHLNLKSKKHTGGNYTSVEGKTTGEMNYRYLNVTSEGVRRGLTKPTGM